MLKITIEMVPSGDESCSRVLEVCEVGNISNLAALSNYRVFRFSPDGSGQERSHRGPGELLYEVGEPFEVQGHMRDAGFWELVRRVAEIARLK
jgi:hypothetical protein